MRNIKNYEDFISEEINLKKTLAGAALGASLAIGNPSFATTDIKKNQTDKTVEVDSVQKIESSDIDIPINGWDKVSWGMTKQQVKNIYSTLSKTTIISKEHSGSDTLLMTDYKVDEYSFDVSFIFKSGKLEEVRLFQPQSELSDEFIGYGDYSNGWNNGVSKIVDKLESKYGIGMSPRGKGLVFGVLSYDLDYIVHLNWIKKNGEIELVCLRTTYGKDSDFFVFEDSRYPVGLTIRYKKIDSSGF